VAPHRLDQRVQALSVSLRLRMALDSDAFAKRAGANGVGNRPLCSRNVVVMTTLVDLRGQLSNLREAIIRLSEELLKVS
jgi:hypothetical protein